MDKEKILKLIQFIVSYATQHEIKLTTVRLIKFLYLADYYFSAFNYGKTFTNFPWRFINYGPYCNEAIQAINDAVNIGLISKKEFEGKYLNEYNIFYCEEDIAYKLKDLFPPEITSNLEKDIKKYGEDTASLLDYVYFETEPMNKVKKGDILDFTKTKPIEKIESFKTVKFSDEAVEIIKENIKKLGEIFKKGEENFKKYEQEAIKLNLYDEKYFEFLDSFEEEPLLIGLKGIIKIVE